MTENLIKTTIPSALSDVGVVKGIWWALLTLVVNEEVSILTDAFILRNIINLVDSARDSTTTDSSVVL